MAWKLGNLLASMPWIARRGVDGDLVDARAPLVILGGEALSVELTSLYRAAVATWANAMAAASPGAPLTGEILYWLGRQLAMRGKAALAINVASDGVTLWPYAATRKGDDWTGTATLPDGTTRALDTPDSGVVHIALAGGPPIGASDSLATLLPILEMSAATEAAIPPGTSVRMGDGLVGANTQQMAEIEASLSRVLQRSGVAVLPPGVSPGEHYGPEPSAGLVALRDQARDQVEAAFGIVGLLQPLTGRDAGPSQWRMAVVRTFNPLATMIEVEASAKLESEIRLNREAWIPASHLDLARATALRAQAAARLGTLDGMTADRAVELAGVGQ